jgi:hypothetical protein
VAIGPYVLDMVALTERFELPGVSAELFQQVSPPSLECGRHVLGAYSIVTTDGNGSSSALPYTMPER